MCLSSIVIKASVCLFKYQIQIKDYVVSFQVSNSIKAVCFSRYCLYDIAYSVSYISYSVGIRRESSILNYHSVSEVCELLAETLACEEDAALDCSYGESELVGYLGVLVAGDVHVEGDAELVVEGV